MKPTAPKIICIFGKIGAGKTTYAEKLIQNIGAVYLGADELMCALYGSDSNGEAYDLAYNIIIEYLMCKATEIAHVGATVVLERGLWTKQTRQICREFFESKGFEYELHFIDVSDEQWAKQIDKRNREISENGEMSAFIENSILSQCREEFEPPTEDEYDVRLLDGVRL